jgi:hypothetical protein
MGSLLPCHLVPAVRLPLVVLFPQRDCLADIHARFGERPLRPAPAASNGPVRHQGSIAR